MDKLRIDKLLLLPQRYVFSSKSQRLNAIGRRIYSCCCYHKGTYFQANHNTKCLKVMETGLLLLPQRYVFSSKSQRNAQVFNLMNGCCCYHKGTYFQANHNSRLENHITKFSCCCYHKGTYFQANHNR